MRHFVQITHSKSANFHTFNWRNCAVFRTKLKALKPNSFAKNQTRSQSNKDVNYLKSSGFNLYFDNLSYIVLRGNFNAIAATDALP